MSIFQRARDMILNPRVTWQAAKGESVGIKSLLINYAAPLALIPAVSSLIGMTIIGIRLPDGNLVRCPLGQCLIGAIVGYFLHLGGLLVGAWIIKLLAPLFKARSDMTLAAKVVIYSMTPVWLSGIFSLVPGLGILSLLGLYGIYLLVLGLGEVLETPRARVPLYTLAILVAGMVISMVLSIVVVGLFYGPMFMQTMAG